MTAFRRLSLLAFALTSALLLLLAACGGGDDDTGDDGGNAPTATESSDDGGNDPTDDSGDDDDGGNDPTPEETEDSGDDDEATAEATEDSGDDDGDGPDVCALLTEDEVGEAIGAPVSAGETPVFSPFLDCGWETENFDFVDLSIIDRDNGELFYNLDLGQVDLEDVDGLGDEAHYSRGVPSRLEVLDGDWYISVAVNVTDLDGDATRDAAIALAEKVLGRLP